MSNTLKKEEVPHSYLDNMIEAGELYALIDGRKDLKNNKFYSLNMKDTDPDFFDKIAWTKVVYLPPKLVKVTSKNLKSLKLSIAEKRLGFFLSSKSDIEVLGGHLQKFVIAEGASGDPYFFKFQDPTVLEVFLNTWVDKTLKIFSGPIERFFVPQILDDKIVKYHFEKTPQKANELPDPESCLVKLTDGQLQLCLRRVEEDFSNTILKDLKKSDFDQLEGLSEESKSFRVFYGVQKAKLYSFHKIEDVTKFVRLLFIVSPFFDEHPIVRNVFINRQIPTNYKFKYLNKIMTEADWQQASEVKESEGWGYLEKKIAKK